MKTMDVLCKKRSEKGLWLERKEVPSINQDEILVKVKKTAICGTDVHIYEWDRWSQENILPPRTLGHEFVGVVVEKGSNVQGVELGDSVSAEGHIVCGVCRNCRAGKKYACNKTIGIGIHCDGAFAEYVKIPKDNFYRIPKDISHSEAAIFDPFGNAVFSASLFNVSGEDILITGAGPVGLMTALICQHQGARNVVITDVNDFRLSLVKDEPRVHPINISDTSIAEVQKKLGMKEGFDLSFEMSGKNSAFESLIDASSHGANIVSLGIFSENVSLDFNKVIFKKY